MGDFLTKTDSVTTALAHLLLVYTVENFNNDTGLPKLTSCSFLDYMYITTEIILVSSKQYSEAII